jgi:hypothetical protein
MGIDGLADLVVGTHGDGSAHGYSGERFTPANDRARALEAVLDEGQVKLVQQRRLDGSIGVERDVRRCNAPADVGAEELPEIWIPRRPLDDLAYVQAERPACRGQR